MHLPILLQASSLFSHSHSYCYICSCSRIFSGETGHVITFESSSQSGERAVVSVCLYVHVCHDVSPVITHRRLHQCRRVLFYHRHRTERQHQGCIIEKKGATIFQM
jgi:hypothetical protein